MASPEVPSLSQILNADVPPAALAFYGRWWQLETWLREVAYVELRAKFGLGWTEHLTGRAPRRAEHAKTSQYMASADDGELLAYADVTDLFGLIEAQWELFACYLPPLQRWQGTSDELRELRNRNAHCRRPHRDDLKRIEQTLRDLEPGARRFYASHGDTSYPEGKRDPLVRDWLLGRHPTAARLLKHAERQYGVRFRLSYSVRPWARRPDPRSVSANQGVLWHATFLTGALDVPVAELWREISRETVRRDALVHLLVDAGHITATFAAVDDAALIADEIGQIFDEILVTSHGQFWTGDDLDEAMAKWLKGADELPKRVQVMTPLALMEPATARHHAVFFAD